MDVNIAKRWYGGQWYRTPEGRVEPQSDPANPVAVARVVDPIHSFLSAEITQGCRALDLGCFAGRFTFAMEQMGALTTGLDCVGWVLQYARTHATERNSKCRFVEGDFENLPFPPQCFELALFPMNIVETSYRQMGLLVDQLTSILTPGGKFCVLMKDGLSSLPEKELPEYDVKTGMMTSINQAPEHDPVSVNSYFWTVGFARHVIERKFQLNRIDQLPDGRFWLVFLNKE